MSKPVFVLNGANLNLLGMREPHIYGTTTLAEIEAMCRERAEQLGLALEFRQSNSEGQLIDWIQEAIGAASAIVINPAAHSFTSIATARCAQGVPLADRRGAHLQHPPARAALPALLRLLCRDRGDLRPRRARLRAGAGGDRRNAAPGRASSLKDGPPVPHRRICATLVNSTADCCPRLRLGSTVRAGALGARARRRRDRPPPAGDRP